MCIRLMSAKKNYPALFVMLILLKEGAYELFYIIGKPLLL